jgi:hypothetical protein
MKIFLLTLWTFFFAEKVDTSRMTPCDGALKQQLIKILSISFNYHVLSQSVYHHHHHHHHHQQQQQQQQQQQHHYDQ